MEQFAERIKGLASGLAHSRQGEFDGQLYWLRMQIPWYIGWSVAVALGYEIFYVAASRAAYYPLRYPQGFWEPDRVIERN
jgi:hypothetical protein